MLIETAILTFSHKGFYSTTMEEVAAAAGITKPVIYQHFRSKRELYLAILSHVGDSMVAAMNQATAGLGTPRKRFEMGFQAYFRFVYEHRSAFELIFGSSPRRDPEFREVLTKVEERIARNVISDIDAGLEGAHKRLVASGVQALAEGIARRYIKEHAREVNDEGTDIPFEDSLASLWAKRMSDLMWLGVREIERPTSSPPGVHR